MSKDLKMVILSVVLWVPLNIFMARSGGSNDWLGIYTIEFLNSVLSVLSYIICLYVSYWFIGDEIEFHDK